MEIKKIAVVGVGHHLGRGGGTGTDVEGSLTHRNSALADGPRSDKGEAKVFCQREDHIPGDGIDVIFNPIGVLHIVVIGKFDEHSRGLGFGHLA